MNIEFAGRLNNPKLILKDFKYWVIILKENGTTLGHSVIILKSNKPNFRFVTEEEMAEFPKVCAWFEEATKNVLGAIKWNYCAMMMKEEFVHFQAVPRYNQPVKFYSQIWADDDWPRRPSFGKLDMSTEMLIELKNELTRI